MSTRNTIGRAALFAAAIISSAVASPLPISLTGIGLHVEVMSSVYSTDRGGAFAAKVSRNPALNDAVFTQFWCVDNENYVNLPDPYIANITPLGDWAGGMNPLVRKGTVVAPGWHDGDILTALQRYQAAAWLLATQNTYLQGGTTVLATDILIQHAIWRLTDREGFSPNNPAIWQNSYYDAAKTYVLDHPEYGKGSWAVVSGVARADGTLSESSRQTFLVQIAPVPEPATYALIGGGLLLLAAFRRRAT